MRPPAASSDCSENLVDDRGDAAEDQEHGKELRRLATRLCLDLPRERLAFFLFTDLSIELGAQGVAGDDLVHDELLSEAGELWRNVW